MNKAFKYRLYPNKEQEIQLSQIAGSCRWIWNFMLAQQNTTYKTTKKFVWFVDMANQLPKLKDTYDWLKMCPSMALQQVCKDQDKTLKSFCKKKTGFLTFRIPQSNGKTKHIKISELHITIPKLGLVRWVCHRPITGVIKSITVSRDVDQWYVSVLTEVPDVEKLKVVDNTIGIDVGISTFATLSDGTKITGPNIYKKNLKKLKKLNRQHSKKKNGSKNKEKSRKKLAKLHQYIRFSRLDFLNKQSAELTDMYDVICVEDLNIAELMRRNKAGSNAKLRQMISDQSWGTFIALLAQKCVAKGKHLTKIGMFAPSTQACSACGHTHKLKLSDRIYICQNPVCNNYLKTKDRDINAANNIHMWGLTSTPNITFKKHTAGTAGINACGDTSTQVVSVISTDLPEVSMKQEACGPLAHRQFTENHLIMNLDFPS
jgi:putative transposase